MAPSSPLSPTQPSTKDWTDPTHCHVALTPFHGAKCPCGVRTVKADNPFHAVLAALQEFDIGCTGYVMIKIDVYAFKSGDMFHIGTHPDEEKEFLDGAKDRKHSTFAVSVTGSAVTIRRTKAA